MAKRRKRISREAMQGAAALVEINPAAPPLERWARREVERDAQTVADAEGTIGHPFRAIDTLMAMERRGTITREMRSAGNRFRDDFALASFDPLRAADIARVSSGAGARYAAHETGKADAKNRVWKALTVLGGPTSPAGSCAWHVLGMGVTVKEWAIREGWGGRPLHIHTAAGILIGALGVLEKHYGLSR